jgi:hypothetical protein
MRLSGKAPESFPNAASLSPVSVDVPGISGCRPGADLRAIFNRQEGSGSGTLAARLRTPK